MSCVVEGLCIGINDLAVNLIGPSTIVSEAVCGHLDLDLCGLESFTVVE